MIIIGCDYHPGFQQIAFVDTHTGEIQEQRRREEAERFYRDLGTEGATVRVGMEASGHARWFERMLSELRFELWIGDAAEIRAKRVRKQKTDRQDAQLILKLMLKDDFPQIWARYRAGGAKALQHGNCGRVSNRAYTAKYRGAVLTRVQARYQDFGPTLASEHLGSDDGLEVHAETLRRWLKEAGLWQRQRRRKPYRQRREAKAHFGELVQLDGSFHEWLEERGPRGCLMHMVDDATTKALGWFSAEETIWAAAGVLRRWIERYTACRKPCTPTGRTCTCGRRMRGSGCAENRR